MKYLLATCLVCVLFSCNKNGTVEPDEPKVEVRAGYSYYRIKNTTPDTLDVSGVVYYVGPGAEGSRIFRRFFYPNETEVVEVNCSTIDVFKLTHFTDGYSFAPYSTAGGNPQTRGLYDVVDRRILDISLIKNQ